MKESKIFIGFLLLFFAEVANAQTNVVVSNRVVAAIDGEPITSNDLKHYASSVGEKLPDDLSSQKELAQKMLQELIVAKLLEKEASSLSIIVEDAEIDAYLAEVRRVNNFSETDFQQVLSKRGIDMKNYQEQVRREIYRSRIMSAVIRNSINVSEEDIDRYLESNPNLLPKEGEVRIAQIFMEGDDSIAIKKKIEQIKAQVAEGKSLESLGEKNYQDLGYVKVENLRPEINAAVKDLSAGELSAPMAIKNGVVMYQLLAKGNEGVKDEVLRQNIRRELFDKRVKERMDRYIKEELPKKYLVETKL